MTAVVLFSEFCLENALKLSTLHFMDLQGLKKNIIPGMNLQAFRNVMETELNKIIGYWMEYGPDYKNGGFVGRVNGLNKQMHNANKGSVLNSRILWTFSVMYKRTGEDAYGTLAKRAFDFIDQYFLDKEYGGVFSEVTFDGKPVSDKKQIYCQAFAIYSLTEYYAATKDQRSLDLAGEIFQLVEKQSLDDTNNGYIEAFSNRWEPLTDFRLSDKDENFPKTMNNHLHLLEAYTNLYQVSGLPDVKAGLLNLVNLFTEFFIRDNGHLELYFDREWNPLKKYVSYGHDIEAAWLLNDAVDCIDTNTDLTAAKEKAGMLAAVFRKEGIDENGGVFNSLNLETQTLDHEKHHWPQAEAMVGLFDAYERTGDENYLRDCFRVYQFIDQFIIDDQNGEWYLRVEKDGHAIMDDKIGYWKCPYHNARACMELIKRIDRLPGNEISG